MILKKRFSKEVFYARQDCIYLIKNTIKNINIAKITVFYFPVVAKLNFQHHYSSLQCHMIRNPSNMLNWCSKHILFLKKIVKTDHPLMNSIDLFV